MIFIGIFVSIILFSIIILIHEWGHFTSARKFGVRVEEFGLGIPPRAKKLFYDKKGTLFSLNWLPLGGFVKLTGEMPYTFLVYNGEKKLYNNFDLEQDIINHKSIFYQDGTEIGSTQKQEILKKLKENHADYNLMNKPTWQQAIIILGGVFMNFVLAWLIFSILFFIGVKPIGINTKLETNLDIRMIPTQEQALKSGLLQKELGVILSPIAGSIAEKSGLQHGDILYEISTCDSKMGNHSICEGGEPATIHFIKTPQDAIDIVQKFAGEKVTFFVNARILNENEKQQYNTEYLGASVINIDIAPDGKIGTYLGENIQIDNDFKYKYNILQSIGYGAIETKNQILLTFQGLGVLLKKILNPETPQERSEAVQQVSGPIGIVDFISSSMSAGVVFLIIIAAIISINLGVFNLLPIPALDGGRFIFIVVNGCIKKIFGKKAIGEKTESIIHVGFFILLIALSIIIAYNDINKIISNG